MASLLSQALLPFGRACERRNNRRRDRIVAIVMDCRSLSFVIVTMLAACAQPQVAAVDASARPLDSLPAGTDLETVRADLLATARERYGAAAVERALAAPTHLIVKRFAGMAPPPPPGAGPDWRAPTPSAMLIRERGEWLAATPDGWRPVETKAAVQLDSILAGSRWWSEAAYTAPCPDFGASNVLLKAPGRAETVRTALCSSAAADLVQAALAA